MNNKDNEAKNHLIWLFKQSPHISIDLPSTANPAKFDVILQAKIVAANAQKPIIRKPLLKKPKFRSKPAKPKKSKFALKSSQQGLGIAGYLPFGVGHFASGSPILGMTFATTELATIIAYLNIADNISVAQDNRDKTFFNEAIPYDQRKSFFDESEDYINRQRNMQNLTIAGFFTMWLLDSTLAQYQTTSHLADNLFIRIGKTSSLAAVYEF